MNWFGMKKEERVDKKRLPELIGDLYRIVEELETMFPGRHFTPDGHLVGSCRALQNNKKITAQGKKFYELNS
jgi:hypothetical protein